MPTSRKVLRPINTRSKGSISRALTFALISMVVTISVVTVFLIYLAISQKARAQLEERADGYITSLVGVLDLPLWDMDERNVKRTGEAYAQDELVEKLRITDSTGEVMFDFRRESESSQVTRASQVLHEGQLVGYVEISLTAKYYTETNRQLLLSGIGTILLISLVLVLATGLILRILLTKPLDCLREIVNAYASGKYDSSEQYVLPLEFQPLVGVLAEMADRITYQITESRNAEMKYRSIIENAVEGLFQSTPEGRFLSTNPSMARILGYDSTEELMENITDIGQQLHVVPARREEFIQLMREGKTVSGFQVQLYRKDRTRVWASIHARPVFHENGQLLLTEGILEDITERKRAEEALITANQQLNDIIEFLPDATFVIDREGRVIAWNRAIEEMTGVSKRDMIGKGDHECTLPFYGERRPHLLDLIGVSNEELESKYHYIHRKGNVLSAEAYVPCVYGGKGAYIFATGAPLLDMHGNRVGAIESIRDISESKRGEEERVRLITAIEQAAEAIIITDSKWTIEYVNPAFELMTAYRKHEIIGQHTRILKSQRHDKAFYKKIRDTLARGEVWSGRLTNRKKDGTFYEAEVTSSPVLDQHGRIINYVSIHRDITLEVRLERELRQAQKMEAIGTLAGGIAHDFNNILAAIIGFTEMALHKVPESTPTQNYLEQVLKAADRAKNLVSQILASSRQTQAQERTPIEIAPVIEEALKLLRASLPATIEICQNIGSETAVALADPTEVHQVVVNLCTNAAHAMEEKGGVLEISLGEVTIDSDADAGPADLKSGHYLRLTVSDTGTGIDPAILDRIFDPYFTTKEVGKGSGLGLAVVHGIAKRHEGAITVSSEPGVGTRFHVYFPKLEDMTVKEADVEEKPLPRGTERVLFVDDEEILVEMGKSVLEWLGYEVTVTTNSLEALELFRLHSNHFDAVITDYTMPNMTGTDLAKEMMRIRPGIPVILCTGFSERVSEDKAREMGIRAFVMKPVNMRDIADTVRRVLDEK